MKRLTRWAKELAVLAVLLLVITFAMDMFRAPQAPPEFDTQVLQTLNGETLSLAERSQDKPLLVYFWATWCGVCKFTTPTVSELAGNGENILSIALRSGDNQQVERWLTAKSMKIPVVNDPQGSLSARWNIGVTPTFVIINKGQVVQSTTGWTSYWGLKFRLWWAAF
ncbi:protein disulfide oxidoreductase [Rouxiella sp. Mn2063]|uniref:protein disulfide oxidoreductase n=1 Tax=Rouxiella sp. Mn2063 TaxID=3395262 RepID=UPI003BD5490F